MKHAAATRPSTVAFLATVLAGILVSGLVMVWWLSRSAGVPSVRAQASVHQAQPNQAQPNQAQPNLAQSTIVRKESLSEDLAQVRQTYNGQLAEYRSAYNNYQISKAELGQLNTLKSLENAVQSTREAMRLRDVVLRTYLELVKLQLIDTFGVTIEHRQSAVDNIDRTIAQLQDHQLAVEQIESRAEVVAQADQFEPLGQAASQDTAYAKALIKLGRLQNVFELAESLNQDIQATAITDLPQLTQSERLRAYDQTNLEFSQVKAAFNEVTAGLAPVDSSQTGDRRDQFRTSPTNLDIDQALSELFAGLSRLISLLDELAGVSPSG